MKRVTRLGSMLAATALAGSITAFHHSVALAQENGAITLAPIVVQGSTNEDPKAPIKGYVAKSSTTATKTGTPILETQQSISVITANEIKAQGAENLSQALGFTPGVVAQPYGADPRFDSPRIRGFDGRQSQFLNGLKMMRTAGAPALDIYGMERVEVLRGPASVMYGQANPGGMINMISKRPTFERFGEIGVQGGSYDTYGTFFDFGGPLAENSDFAYRLTGVGRKAGEQTDFIDNKRYFIAPALTWKPNEDTSLTILTSLQHDTPSSPSGLPPQLTLNAGGGKRLGRDFFVGDKSFDDSDRILANIGYEFEHRFNEVWTFRQNARYSDFDWQYQALGMATSGLAPDGHTIRRTATFQDERLKTFNIDNNLQGEFSTGGIDHKVLMGLDYRYFDNNVTTEFWEATPIDAFNPVYGGPIKLGKQTLYAAVDSDLTQIGVYIQDELAYENWRATFGLRQDWASTGGGSTNAKGLTRPLDKDDEKLTGRAGLSYVFDNGLAPYISYATSFEPVPVPASGQLLEPTTGEQFELGIKYQPEGWNGFFSAAVFDLRQKNVLTTTVVNGNPVASQIGEVQVKGLELEGVASLVQGLDLHAAYTYMDAKIVEGANDGNRADNTPEHAASLWLDYTFQEGTALEGFGIGGGVRYIGQRYGDTANTYDLDAVALVDASLHYQKDGIKASLNLTNLADKEYASSCSSFGCYYGDGRKVMGKVSFGW